MRIVKSGGVFLLGLYVVFLSSWGHVGATPRGCPSHGRPQGAAPTRGLRALARRDPSMQ